MRKIAFCIFIALLGVVFAGCKKSYTWYVEPEFERAWENIVRKDGPPGNFKEIKVWDGGEIPEGDGILIASKPRQTQEKITVYSRLPYDLEFQGAILLALDPWMVFRKYRNQDLSADQVYSGITGNGLLLIPGKDPRSVNAWTARLIQERPGAFPAAGQIWSETEQSLFQNSRFPRGSETYTWADVFIRLMGHETAWVYAPLSEIRRYHNPRKSILEAVPFPERETGSEYSLQASLLWALPLNIDDKDIKDTIDWLKNPQTQTLIANTIEWMPANPYGTPYDPISFVSHRHWLTASSVYEVN